LSYGRMPPGLAERLPEDSRTAGGCRNQRGPPARSSVDRSNMWRQPARVPSAHRGGARSLDPGRPGTTSFADNDAERSITTPRHLRRRARRPAAPA